MKTGFYQLITTNLAKQECWKSEDGKLGPIGKARTINVHPEFQYQKIRGFGGAFTEASSDTFHYLLPEAQEEFLKAYFSEDGLCYNVGRTHINSCDFALGNYTYVTQDTPPEDISFSSFSLEHDEKSIFSLIARAESVRGESIPLLVSPWSPPAFMKTNHEMNHGGRLKPEYRFAWAHYLARYIKEARKSGVMIAYMTVQNEPNAIQTWDSCQYSAQEELEFVRDFLGPVLEQEGLSDVKIIIWDHDKEIAYERADAILSDEKANAYIHGVGMHWYSGDYFEELSLIQEKYPDKEIFFTEGCVEYSRFKDPTEIRKSEMYAHDMMGNLNHGLSLYLDWNLLLNESGGPNHVGNFCFAPIMACDGNKNIQKNGSYYYIGHFSRYIMPGAIRIATSRYCSEVETTAFLNPDGSRCVVLLNRTERLVECNVRESGLGKQIMLEPHSIASFCYQPE
ncbi:MAG: glycoside hydrolase family 30 beta sandwich domain-containing protein [Lachnospiraceae bacterium]